MKAAVLFSGGKDSVMSLNYAINNGDDVKYLLSIKSENNESYMFHVPNIHLTKLISYAVEIPLIEIKTTGIKEEELKDLKKGLEQLKNLGIEIIYTGALFSTYQKSRIEKLTNELNMKTISPYWHYNPKKYMNLIIDLGFKVIISRVSANGLDKTWLGRLINKKSLSELERISEKTYFNLTFEGGEAETLVIDGPIYKKRIEIIETETNWHLDNGTYNIINAKLINKK